MFAGSSSASRVHNTAGSLEILLAYKLDCQSVQKPFSIGLGELLGVLAQIHQDFEKLWPFLKCPELCTLKSQIDLIAQLLLSLIKELQGVIHTPLESHQVGLSNPDLDALGKPLLGFLKFVMSRRLITLRK